MNLVPRIIATFVLLGLALFCTYGFLASLEPGTNLLWRLGYGGLWALSLLGTIALWARRGRPSP